MALTDIIYLTKTQYDTLVGSGSITVGGVTYNYDENADYRVKYEPEAVPVKGVQVNAVDLTPDANGKVNVPLASSSTAGVALAKMEYGIGINTSGGSIGALCISAAGYTHVEGLNQFKPIVPASQGLATKKALGVTVTSSTSNTTWTAEEKSTARATLGATTFEVGSSAPATLDGTTIFFVI